MSYRRILVCDICGKEIVVDDLIEDSERYRIELTHAHDKCRYFVDGENK